MSRERNSATDDYWSKEWEMQLTHVVSPLSRLVSVQGLARTLNLLTILKGEFYD